MSHDQEDLDDGQQQQQPIYKSPPGDLTDTTQLNIAEMAFCPISGVDGLFVGG